MIASDTAPGIAFGGGVDIDKDRAIVPMDGAPLDHFGMAIAMAGSTFAVGSPWHAMGRGAYVYTNVGKAEPDAGVSDAAGDDAAIDASVGLADRPGARHERVESSVGERVHGALAKRLGGRRARAAILKLS